MTKIAVISTMAGSPWGGSEELWAAMANAALSDGHEVTVSIYSWSSVPHKVAILRERGARILYRPRPQLGRLKGAIAKLKSPFQDLFNWQPEVICISQGGTYDPFLMNLGNFFDLLYSKSIPYVIVCHRNEDTYIPNQDVRETAINFFERAARVLFVSEHNLRTAERQLATTLPHAMVVRNPVNLNDIGALNWQNSKTLNLANVARLEVDYKGQDILFEALSSPVWCSRNWQLNLYGDGPDINYLESLAGHYKISDHVKFHGHVKDIKDIWSKNHLLVLPSRREGTPLALVEGMLCGRPAVVTDVGGNAEWIEEYKTGFVAEAPTAKSLRMALERAWEAQADWEKMGLNAYEIALQKFDKSPGHSLLKIIINVVI